MASVSVRGSESMSELYRNPYPPSSILLPLKLDTTPDGTDLRRERATRTERAGEAARERACGGVLGAQPLGKLEVHAQSHIQLAQVGHGRRLPEERRGRDSGVADQILMVCQIRHRGEELDAIATRLAGLR